MSSRPESFDTPCGNWACAPGSPERDYYVWSDTDQRYPDVRIIFTDTEKSNWTWDAKAQAYLYDHQFDGTPLLPGVMGTETFAEVASVLCTGFNVEAIE